MAQQSFNIIHIISGTDPHKETSFILTKKTKKESAIYILEQYILPNSEDDDTTLHDEYKELLNQWKQSDEKSVIANHAPSRKFPTPSFNIPPLAELLIAEVSSSYDFHYYFESVQWDTNTDLEIVVHDH